MRWPGLTLLCVLLAPCAVAQAPDPSSAAYALPGCRDAANETSGSQPYVAGYCAGMVQGIGYLARVCGIPAGTTRTGVLRQVLAYIEARPERQRESFAALVREALEATWPCKG